MKQRVITKTDFKRWIRYRREIGFDEKQIEDELYETIRDLQKEIVVLTKAVSSRSPDREPVAAVKELGDREG